MQSNIKTSHIVFRNPRNMIWYLQRRPGQAVTEPNFILGPNQTVEALDAAEEALLASMGLIDVAKETPAIANSIDTLKREVEEEKSKNADLLAQLEAMKKTAGKIDTVPASLKKR